MEVPNIPGDPSRGSHRVPLDRVLYIEQSDFRQARNVIIIVIDSLTERGRAEYITFFSSQSPERGYHRLSPDQPVGLKHASLVISVEDVIEVHLQNSQAKLLPCVLNSLTPLDIFLFPRARTPLAR